MAAGAARTQLPSANTAAICIGTLELARPASSEEDLHKKALSFDPNFSKAINNIGNAYIDIGKIKDGEISYKKAIEINPDFAEAHHNLSKVLKFTKVNSDVDKMVKLYESVSLNEHERYHICFALGKIYGDIGDNEKAFSFLNVILLIN